MTDPIRFDDGAGYERMMGVWSRMAGTRFLDWLAPPTGLAWLDVGCGNGAFTELLVQRCAPSAVTGVEPSNGQLDYARTRPATKDAVTWLQGDALALPVADATFDAATMALVLFFVPDPVRGIAEMIRATKPGALIAAYNWDIPGGGFPLAPVGREMREMGFPAALPPSVDTARLDRMVELWEGAGLEDVQTTTIEVQRTFDDFEDLWQTCLLGASLRQKVLDQPAEVQAELKARVKAKCSPDAQGRITWTARANAVKGLKAS